ncbi:MAG TPA: hypothetical protein VFK41_09575 [Nocardioidaceae bacterium]|nr:hypothetical protein [Nocardioidaceae bacterium]
MPSGYERLHVEPVRRTAERLHARIQARLPDRNLGKVSAELLQLIDDVGSGSRQIRGRLRVARLVSNLLLAVAVAGSVVLLGFAFRDAFSDKGPDRSFDWLPLVETTVNDLVFVAVAIFFLHSIPNRLLRGHTLRLLHRLRSLAHIIDMHQLTKDPERLRTEWTRTSQSVEVNLNREEMEAYLDYCSELLSLVGKAAALCAEESQDPLVLDTVSTLETITNGMSRKIWQKISVLS